MAGATAGRRAGAGRNRWTRQPYILPRWSAENPVRVKPTQQSRSRSSSTDACLSGADADRQPRQDVNFACSCRAARGSRSLGMPRTRHNEQTLLDRHRIAAEVGSATTSTNQRALRAQISWWSGCALEQTVALVSDAAAPAHSGFRSCERLSRGWRWRRCWCRARARGLALPANRRVPTPRKRAERERLLAHAQENVVAFESPRRWAATSQQLADTTRAGAEGADGSGTGGGGAAAESAKTTARAPRAARWSLALNRSVQPTPACAVPAASCSMPRRPRPGLRVSRKLMGTSAQRAVPGMDDAVQRHPSSVPSQCVS